MLHVVCSIRGCACSIAAHNAVQQCYMHSMPASHCLSLPLTASHCPSPGPPADSRTTLVFNMPLAEVVFDFFDQLKSRSKGYASMEYKITGYRVNELVLLEVKINGELAPPLSVICHRDASYKMGKGLCSKLKELIPRQMFRVPIQVGWQDGH